METDLPGHDLIAQGLDDLVAGAETAAALLVSIGAPRLRQLGLQITDQIPGGEHRLYELLSRTDPDSAHSRYNALVRRLVSFERRWVASPKSCAHRGRRCARRARREEAHAGSMQPTSNAAPRDAAPAECRRTSETRPWHARASRRDTHTAVHEGAGREADRPAHVYLTGGATAVLYGWRESTIDVDMKMVPDLDRVFRIIPEIKERLQINIELASPDDFIPVREGWEDRSPFIAQEGHLVFRHFDLYAQALSKIERGMRKTRATSGKCSIVAWSIESSCWSISRRSSRGCIAIPR